MSFRRNTSAQNNNSCSYSASESFNLHYALDELYYSSVTLVLLNATFMKENNLCMKMMEYTEDVAVYIFCKIKKNISKLLYNSNIFKKIYKKL